VVPTLRPVIEGDSELSVWCGVDASTKRDSTALVACTYDKAAKLVRLVNHKVFTPGANDPVDFGLVERTLLDWSRRYRLRKVWCDPFQMASVMQRLRRNALKVEEYPQTSPNLMEAVSNLLDLVQGRALALYPDASMRLAANRAIIIESSRGWRLDKMKQSHKIDLIVALSMACLAAVRGQSESTYVADLSWVGPSLSSAEEMAAWRRKRFYGWALSGGQFTPW
jgi:phage terminase large subunit-like protein